MCKLEKVIIRHEKARALVSGLNENRRSLVRNCEGLDSIDVNHNQVIDIGLPCGVVAWDQMVKENSCLPYDEQSTFEDVFYSELYGGEGACDNCKKAFEIKRGPLAEAKKELGNAKRSLSRLGKKLIGESECQ